MDPQTTRDQPRPEPLLGEYRVQITAVDADGDRLTMRVLESSDPREIGTAFDAHVAGGIGPLCVESRIPDLVGTKIWVDVRSEGLGSRTRYEVEIPPSRRT